ncbi:MAG: hypothetical protein SF162_07760 [bacterium]|nr:hypothetical protein [bacterium]
MSEPTPTPPLSSAALPYPLRPGEAVYLDMRAEWRRFAPPPDDEWIESVPDLPEGSAAWRHLLPKRADLEALERRTPDDDPAMEYDDGTPVYMPSRRLLAAIILIALLSLLAYEFYGLFVEPIRIPELPAPPTTSV